MEINIWEFFMHNDMLKQRENMDTYGIKLPIDNTNTVKINNTEVSCSKEEKELFSLYKNIESVYVLPGLRDPFLPINESYKSGMYDLYDIKILGDKYE